jgi:hypothetical protein
MRAELRPELNLSVLRRLLGERRRANENIHNVAMAMFKPGSKLQYRINVREYFGRVEAVIGLPGSTRVRVVNLSTLKKRDIQLRDITGLVQEN